LGFAIMRALIRSCTAADSNTHHAQQM
jgi:hypothetical protein